MQDLYSNLSIRFQGKMIDNNSFTNASIKIKIYKKLSKLSKKERHTISDQLDIIIEFYKKSKEVSN